MVDDHDMEITPITHDDIRDLLLSYAAAVQLDQIRVDCLPVGRHHPFYDDAMWRRCRRNHLEFIDQLLPTVQTLPAVVLQQLTRVAIIYEPAIVREIMIDLFSEAANGICPAEELSNATMFFGWLIKDASRRAACNPSGRDARLQMMQWLSVTDPLHIAEDAECGYGCPSGSVH